MDPTTSLIGRTIGRYLVQEFIGQGGMGVVYRAYDRASRRLVALKTLAAGAADGDTAAQLQQEGRWLSRCRSPHVVQVYDAGRSGEVDFIAMELMRATLDTRIARGPASSGETVRVGLEMLEGLDAAHREGVLHCDIKPANVGIDADEGIKLLDFGVARPLPESPHFKSLSTGGLRRGLVGTLHYMSPEQLRGEPLDERSDIYSVGAVLYELASGRRPFGQEGLVPLIDAVLHATPVNPSSWNPDLDLDVDDVVMTALAKSPADRYSSAREMFEALRQARPPQVCLGGESALAPGLAS